MEEQRLAIGVFGDKSNEQALTSSVRKADSEDSDEDGEDCWTRFNKTYDESTKKVKDDLAFFVHGKTVRFSRDSLHFFGNKNRFRWACVWITTHPRFETFIISMIALNSITLGIKDYTDVNNESRRNRVVDACDPIFTYSFLAECVLKIVSMGWISGHNTYLHDAWNWLDFIVVVTSLLNEIPSMAGVSGLRTFRLFRPLRSLTTMPSMRILIGTLLQSVAQLVGILGLMAFFFLIFAILGVSLWDGASHYRCYLTSAPDPLTGEWALQPDDLRLCADEYRNCDAWLNPDTGEEQETFCRSRYVAYDAGLLPADWLELTD
jgi:hypothetical protein